MKKLIGIIVILLVSVSISMAGIKSVKQFNAEQPSGIMDIDSDGNLSINDGLDWDDTVTITTHTTLTESSAGIVLVDETNATTLTLPTVADASGKIFVIKAIGNLAGSSVTLDGEGSEEVDGSATNTDMDAQHDSIIIYSDGSQWRILSSYLN